MPINININKYFFTKLILNDTIINTNRLTSALLLLSINNSTKVRKNISKSIKLLHYCFHDDATKYTRTENVLSTFRIAFLHLLK